MNKAIQMLLKAEIKSSICQEVEDVIRRNHDKDDMLLGILVNSAIGIAVKHSREGVEEKRDGLGMSMSDIDEMFDDIVSVVIEKYLDT